MLNVESLKPVEGRRRTKSYEKYWGSTVDPYTVFTHEGRDYSFLPEGDHNHAILIRPEFVKVKDKILADSPSTSEYRGRGGLCISGSGGIGLSSALPYLLIECLRAKRPVLTVHYGYRVLYTEQGVFQPDCNTLLECAETIIVLYDSPGDGLIEHDLIDQDTNVYFVMLSVPRPDRCKYWLKEQSPEFIVFHPLPRHEYAAIVAFSPEEHGSPEGHYTALELYDLLGPGVRYHRHKDKKTINYKEDLSFFTHHAGTTIACTTKEQWEKEASNHYTWSYLMTSNTRFMYDYHELFPMIPVGEFEMKGACKTFADFKTTLPSPLVARILMNHGCPAGGSLQEQLNWIKVFKASPEIQQAMSDTISLKALSFSSTPSKIIVAEGKNRNLAANLPTAPDILDENPRPVQGYLYLSPSSDLFDALYTTSGDRRIFLMVYPIGPLHYIPQEGIRRVLSVYEPDRVLADIVVVFPVSTEEQGKAIFAAHPKGTINASDEVPCDGDQVKIGYLVIDNAFQTFERLIENGVPMLSPVPVQPSEKKRKL